MMKFFIASVLFSLSAISSGATIYECRAYNDSTFFSADPCGKQKAVGVALHTVPDGMPFDQQVKIIEDGLRRKAANARQEDSERNRLGQCGQIDRELMELQTKYTNWQYVPIDEVNADQAREKDLRARRSQYQCHSR